MSGTTSARDADADAHEGAVDTRSGTADTCAGTASASPGSAGSQDSCGSHNSAAARLGRLAETVLGGPLPVRLKTWDGGSFGPAEAPAVVVRSRRALRRLVWQPGELGLAEAYISGDLDIEGDLEDGLRRMWHAVRGGALHAPRLSLTERRRLLTTALKLGALGPRPPVPASRARLDGRVHSRSRDRAAISHHYDLSNEFYRLLLDDTMAYSCGFWTGEPIAAVAATDAATSTSTDAPTEVTHADPRWETTEEAGRAAQRAKLELICRKLDLRPGSRLLDIGCGWGSLTLYAAAEHGVRVTAVTLAAEQAAHVREQVRERGLTELVQVHCAHWRDIGSLDTVREAPVFDAVATVEMGEHVGDAEYPEFTATLHRHLRPRGRALVQQMSRGRTAPGGGAFIESYIAPDMHMRPLGETVGLLEGAGLEVRNVQSLREDYVHTVAVWRRTLEDNWAAFVKLTGEETARVWRLYLVGGALAFAERRMGVDQILSVRPDEHGGSSMEPSPLPWYATSAPGKGPLGPEVPAPEVPEEPAPAESRSPEETRTP